MFSLRYRTKFRDTDFYRLFNLKDEKSLGRAMILANAILYSIGAVFISGTFQTAFLAINGIDIVRVGIITFLPYFCSLISLLAPKFLSKFPRRRWLLVFNLFFYFGCTVLATTIMPMFVQDPGARTFWFAFFLVLGNVSHALIGSCTNAWNIKFLPEGRDRNIYFSVTNIVTNVLSTAAAIGAALAADALAGSPRQHSILVGLRLAALAVIIIGGALQLLIPKEYPYERSSEGAVKIREVVTVPLRNRQFAKTVSVSYIWGFICAVNSATWTYYLLNTVGMPYAMTYISSGVTAIGSLFLLPLCRRIYHHTGWYKMMLINVATVLVLDASAVFITAKTLWLFVVYSIFSGLNLVCMQLTTSNTFYLHLPEKDTDHYIIFNNISANIAALLGSMFGTWCLSLLEKPDGSALFTAIGLDFYPSQLLVVIKLILMAGLILYIRKLTPPAQSR